MTQTTTILLRHGQTPLSAEKRFAGAVDVPLTDIGVRQAEAAAARLAARGGLDLIVTSPLQRARQTADAVAAATGAAVQLEEGLREGSFGKWEGLSFAEASGQWPEEMAAWLARPGTPPPGGESFADVALRVGAALDELLAGQRGRTVLIVSPLTPRSRSWSPARCSPRRPRRCCGCSSTWQRCARSTGIRAGPPRCVRSTTRRTCVRGERPADGISWPGGGRAGRAAASG